MRYGICLPYMERDYDRAKILAWCRGVDAGPFHSLSCGERITGYTFEMRTLMAAAAAVTERVRIVPSLYVLPMHNAVWAAKEIATLDVLSGGRVTLVVGVGGRENDFRAVGASLEKRHQRMDEQVAEMRRIWAGEPPFEGADPVGPQPLQAGGPPILIGAMGPKSMARGAQWAQGVYAFAMQGEPSELRANFDMADRAWEQAGRADRPHRVGGMWFSLADNAPRRLKEYVYGYLRIAGEQVANKLASRMTRSSPDAIRRAIDGAREAGAEELVFVPATADLSEVERLSELLSR